MAKTLEVGGKEEKLFLEQLISGNNSLIQASMAFVIYQHLPTEEHKRLYKGVPERVPGEACHVREAANSAEEGSLISWLSLYLPGKPPWTMYPNRAP